MVYLIIMKRIKRTTESLSKEINAITNGHYSLQSEFISVVKKVTIKHNDCGNVYRVTPAHFLYDGRRCPICSRIKRGLKRRQSDTQFREKVTSKYGSKYTVLEKYTKSNVKIRFRCNVCDKEFYITPNNLLRGRGCPYCGKKKASKNETLTAKEFDDRLRKCFDSRVVALDTYVKAKVKIRFKCLNCGFVWTTTPDNVMVSKGCPKCIKRYQARQASKGIDNFKNEVNRITNGEYIVVSSTYINNRTKIRIKHLKCNHDYLVTPHNFLLGKRCPFCKCSSLEENVANCLDKLHISYKEHAHMSWLKYSGYQHLDFYIPSRNIAIECDGQQHYKPVDFAGDGMDKAKQLFEENKLRDKNKDVLCKKHGIKLIRIPYTKFPLRVSDFNDFING